MKAGKLIAAAAASCVAFALALTAASGQAPPQAGLSANQQAQIQAVVRQYLLAHPEVVEEAMKTLETRRAMARYQKIISDPRHFAVGPKDARIRIVEFFDYRCPHCKDALGWTMSKVRTRPDVRVTFVEFPILSPQSLEASQAAIASMKQGRYLAFHQAMMGSRGTLESKEIDALAKRSGLDVARLRRDMRDPAIMKLLQDNTETAADAKIEGTPAFIINGKFYSGYGPADLDRGLREATAAANRKTPS